MPLRVWMVYIYIYILFFTRTHISLSIYISPIYTHTYKYQEREITDRQLSPRWWHTTAHTCINIYIYIYIYIYIFRICLCHRHLLCWLFLYCIYGCWADLVEGIGFAAQLGCRKHVSNVGLLAFEISCFHDILLMVSDSLVLYFDTNLMHVAPYGYLRMHTDAYGSCFSCVSLVCIDFRTIWGYPG